MRCFKNRQTRLQKKNRRVSGRRSSRKACLSLESLEVRDLFSISPVLPAPPTVAELPPLTGQTTMTELAQQLQQAGKMPLPSGPTEIFLNFDGWNDCPYNSNTTIDPFEADDATIQDILYRTTEIFAPFNVRVEQIKGNGAVSDVAGSTTVFVNATTTGDFTPGDSLDFPSKNNPNGGDSHILNSDANDVCFVDPNAGVGATAISQDMLAASAIAHEAGHTLGLWHVRTDGKDDYQNGVFAGVSYDPALPPDVMSYDSPNDYFSNTDFSVTVANNSDSGIVAAPDMAPKYNGNDIALQNSFTYLQTALGARPATSHVAVIDENQSLLGNTENLVDPGYYNDAPSAHPATISLYSSVSGTLQQGDYAAYELTIPSSWPANQSVSVAATGGILQNYLISDQTGYEIAIAASHNGYVDFQPTPGHVYAIVASAAPGQSGAFSFNVGVGVGVSLAGRNFTLTDANQQVTGRLEITSQTGATITGRFIPNDGSNMHVPVSGHVGPAVDGVAGLIFGGTVRESKYDPSSEPGVNSSLTETDYQVQFLGHVSPQPRLLPIRDVLAGNGTYVVTDSSTWYDSRGRSTGQTSWTVESSSFVAGSADFVSVANPGTSTADSAPPAATADTYVLGPTGPYQASAEMGVLANDVSGDGQPLHGTATLVSTTSHGSLTLNADGSFSYAPDATFQGLDRFTYQAGDNGLNSKTVTVTLLSYHASLVDKLYQQVLHRPAEDNGLVYWTSQLDAGQPLDAVAKGIFNSAERLDPLVEQFYQQYLSRDTDAGGLAHWVQDWQAKGDPRDVVDSLLASQEFFDDAGDTNSGFISLLYQRVLERPADQAGLGFWSGQMASPANESRFQIASQFYDTHEKHVDLVDFLFGEYFQAGASPDPAPFVQSLDDGQTQTQIEQAIIDSTAYQNAPPEPAADAVGRALYIH